MLRQSLKGSTDLLKGSLNKRILTAQLLINFMLFATTVDDERMIPILLDHDWMIKETSYCKLASCHPDTYKRLKEEFLND